MRIRTDCGNAARPHAAVRGTPSSRDARPNHLSHGARPPRHATTLRLPDMQQASGGPQPTAACRNQQTCTCSNMQQQHVHAHVQHMYMHMCSMLHVRALSMYILGDVVTRPGYRSGRYGSRPTARSLGSCRCHLGGRGTTDGSNDARRVGTRKPHQREVISSAWHALGSELRQKAEIPRCDPLSLAGCGRGA